jgi:hypothetical protein
VEGLKARRGDLSGPVLAILVTLILLAIGAVLVAYFTLFTGQAPSPVLAVKDQPVAYRVGITNNVRVEVVVENIGAASVTLHSTETRLRIVSPPVLVSALIAGTGSPERALGSSLTIAPGESKTLIFAFDLTWTSFAPHRSAGAVLVVKDTAGNTIGQFEVRIRIVGGG